jgi:hypothetical protein
MTTASAVDEAARGRRWNDSFSLEKATGSLKPFAIVCDSSPDLQPAVAKSSRLTVVPFAIDFGVENSVDDGGLRRNPCLVPDPLWTGQTVERNPRRRHFDERTEVLDGRLLSTLLQARTFV